MLLSWRAKRQLTIFFTVFGAIAAVIIFFVARSLPELTCSDGKKNQGEERVDCGGPCVPCVKQPKDIVTLWTRVLKIGDNVYEAASLVENPNLFYGLPLFKYTFKLYDAHNVLVAAKEGQTFLNPQDTFVMLGANIHTGNRKPVRAFMEIMPLSEWQYVDADKKAPSLIVSEKKFSNQPFASLRAYLLNQSVFPVKDVYAAAVLYNQEGNAIAASLSKIEIIPAETGRTLTFTWPSPLDEEPASSEIFTRLDLTSKRSSF